MKEYGNMDYTLLNSVVEKSRLEFKKIIDKYHLEKLNSEEIIKYPNKQFQNELKNFMVRLFINQTQEIVKELANNFQKRDKHSDK